jgi:segregation and condensation protein B
MTQDRSADILEALLLSTDRPLSAARLCTAIPHVTEREVGDLVRQLNGVYETTGRAFRVRAVAGGYRLFTEPEFDAYVEALAVTMREVRLSQAALETLAVVAYRQPVSKNDVEFVRGCDCDGVLRTLLSRRLLAIQGRSEAPGRPLLYATTDRFLEYFGLASLADLPDWSEIVALVGDSSPAGRLTLVRGSDAHALGAPAGPRELSLEPGELQGLQASELAGEAEAIQTPLATSPGMPAELAVTLPGKDAT